MALPKGMSERNIPLSSEMASTHGLEMVRGVVLRERGDGWVTNSWANHHLSGNVIQYRRRDTVYGKRWHNEFVTIDTALLEVEQVYGSIMDETERIAGGQTEDGTQLPGEIGQLSTNRLQLGRWLLLTSDEKTALKESFGQIASARSRAINPLNVAAGVRAARMSGLKDSKGRDNPSAIMAMTHPLESQLTARFNELIGEKLPTNNSRQRRLLEWAFQDSRRLDTMHNLLERLIINQDDYDLAELRGKSRQVRFRVQPFNLLAHELQQTHGRIEDTDVLITTRNGLEFQRMHNYFAQPFRRITAGNKTKLDSRMRRDGDSLMADLEERLAVLSATSPGGAYNTLVSRLEPLATDTIQALRHSNTDTARKTARQFRWLLAYHCIPANDPEATTWYRHSL